MGRLTELCDNELMSESFGNEKTLTSEVPDVNTNSLDTFSNLRYNIFRAEKMNREANQLLGDYEMKIYGRRMVKNMVKHVTDEEENWDGSIKNNVDLLEVIGLKTKVLGLLDEMSSDVKEIVSKLLDALKAK